MKEQGIELYDSSVGEKQAEPLEKIPFGQVDKYIQTGDSKLKGLSLHSSEKRSDFSFRFIDSKTRYLIWNSSGLSRDLTEKAPKMENENYSYIEVPVSGKGTLKVAYHLLDYKDLSKTSSNQQLAVYNQNGERQGDVQNLDFKRTVGKSVHSFKVAVSEGSTFARIYFSKNYRKDEKRPLGEIGITSIVLETEN